MKKLALSLLLFSGLLVGGIAHAAAGFKSYSPGMIERSLGQGKTIFVDFYATWCSTCRTQARVIDELVKENPDYAKSMEFIKVDWDEYRSSDLVRKYGVPRRSTLIVLKGDQVLGKIIAQTGKSTIKSLMDKGL